MVVETDAPYLAPQSRRGRRNEPAFVAETAAALAALKGLALRDVERITTRNACALFRLPCPPPAPEIAYPIRNSLYLNVTNRCSNRCVFCTRETRPLVKGHDLTLEREPSAQEILDAAGDVSGYDEVVFCGFGEPLLRWDVVREVARELKRARRPRPDQHERAVAALPRPRHPPRDGRRRRRALGEPQRARRRRLRPHLPPGRRRGGLRRRSGSSSGRRGASCRA